MSLPEIASQEQWLAARKELLAAEKELTRRRDELNAQRRRMPMVEITKDYVFHGPEGDVGLREHLAARDTSFAVVSRAPLEKLERWREKRGWSIRWYSSEGSDFNYDFHVTLDESVAPVEYNFRSADEHRAAGTGYYVEGEQPLELPGESYFLRDGDRVFHTNSVYARGGESTGGAYYFLDNTALGRQEEWEEPKGRAGAHIANPDFA